MGRNWGVSSVLIGLSWLKPVEVGEIIHSWALVPVTYSTSCKIPDPVSGRGILAGLRGVMITPGLALTDL